MPEDKPPMDVRPSDSTIGSAVGAMLAVFIIMTFQYFHITVDGTQGTIIGGGMSALAGWFFRGGRSADTE